VWLWWLRHENIDHKQREGVSVFFSLLLFFFFLCPVSVSLRRGNGGLSSRRRARFVSLQFLLRAGGGCWFRIAKRGARSCSEEQKTRYD
jgi:hypothetical protein